MDKKAYLTFDDGPNAVYTPKILDILKENNIKATFFVCGKNVKKHPELLKRIFDEGHSIENHSYKHSLFKSIFSISEELDKTNGIIKETIGITPRYYRPPYGIILPWVKKALEKRNMKIVRYTVNARDWVKRSPKDINDRIIPKLSDGSIVLMHDGAEGGAYKSRRATVEALPELISAMRGMGFTFAIFKD